MKKITKIEIKGLKAIDHRCENINGHHILVTAKNKKGKSTFLDSLLFGLGYKDHAPPVRNGEEEGLVHLWTEDGYEFESTRDKIKDTMTVSVKLPGEKLFDKKVSAVGSVVGEIIFDPFEFCELSKTESGKKKQIEIVKSLLTEEERAELTKIERQIKANEEARLETGRDLKRMKGAVEAKSITQLDVQTYKTHIDVKDLNDQKNTITKANENITSVQSRFDDRAKRIEALTSELAELEKQQKAATEFLANNKIQHTVDLDSKIQVASHHNTMVNKVAEYQKEFTAYQKLEEQYGEAGSLIDSQRQAYRDAIRSLDLPIPDLTFDEETLIYKGQPVHPQVLSTSEQMALGAMIRIAMNSECGVMVIHRGESFDRDSMNELIDEADNYGLQLFIEKVMENQEELKIEFLTKK